MIVGLLCLMIPDVVGRCNSLEILKGFDFLMSKYYWEGSDIEEVYEKNLYERSISQVLCKGIRQESHLTQNIEVLRQKKFVNTLNLVDKNIDLKLKCVMRCQSTDCSTIEFNNKLGDACKPHNGLRWINSAATALVGWKSVPWHGL